MSALMEVKNLIVSHLNMSSSLKGAVLGVLNNIDTDLDINGYVTSPETDESLNYLEQVLSGLEDQDEEEEVIIKDKNKVRVEADVEQ